MVVDIGLDLVAVSDVAAAIGATTGERYLARLYTDDEVADCQNAAGIDPALLAAWFAAKEAAIKVLSVGEDGVSMREIEIRCDPTGRPRVILHGRAASFAAQRGILELTVSVTYDAEFAAAFVAAVRRASPG